MKKKRLIIIVLAVILTIAVCANIFFMMGKSDGPQPIETTYNDFVDLVKSEHVSDIEYVYVYDNAGIVQYKVKEDIYTLKIADLYFSFNTELLDTLSKNHIPISFKVVKRPFSILGLVLTIFPYLILLMFIGIAFVYIRKAFFEDNLVERVDTVTSTFKDIAGYHNVKKELMQIVHFLNDPKPYLAMGSVIPKGLLFKGPPGTGKTQFARSLAGEIKAPFFHIAASKIENKWVGSGSRRLEKIIRTVEKAARKHGKAVLFIDEIDAIGMNRNKRTVVETNQTINALLTAMDGFTDTKILFIAATNMDEVLDPALVRAGRFDKQITLPHPNLQNRLAILEFYLGKTTYVDPKVFDKRYINTLATQTNGMCNSDLKELINGASIAAVVDGKTEIGIQDLRSSLIRMRLGPRSEIVLNAEEERIVAYHEAGHAVVQGLTHKNGWQSVDFITIEPHGSSLGHVLIVEDDNVLKKAEEIRQTVEVLLAGRVVEHKVLNDNITTGAMNDLKVANELLKDYISRYGMLSRPSWTAMYNEAPDSKDLTAHISDLRELILRDTFKIVKDNWDLIEAVAEHLMEHKSMSQEELSRLFLAQKLQE